MSSHTRFGSSTNLENRDLRKKPASRMSIFDQKILALSKNSPDQPGAKTLTASKDTPEGKYKGLFGGMGRASRKPTHVKQNSVNEEPSLSSALMTQAQTAEQSSVAVSAQGGADDKPWAFGMSAPITQNSEEEESNDSAVSEKDQQTVDMQQHFADILLEREPSEAEESEECTSSNDPEQEQNQDDAAEYAFTLIDKIKSQSLTRLQENLLEKQVIRHQSISYVDTLISMLDLYKNFQPDLSIMEAPKLQKNEKQLPVPTELSDDDDDDCVDIKSQEDHCRPPPFKPQQSTTFRPDCQVGASFDSLNDKWSVPFHEDSTIGTNIPLKGTYRQAAPFFKHRQQNTVEIQVGDTRTATMSMFCDCRCTDTTRIQGSKYYS